MRGSFTPLTSGVHRSACFALYRALLRRSQQVLPPASTKLFAQRTKGVFRTNAKARSHAAIRAALDTGYSTLRDLTSRQSLVLSQLLASSHPPDTPTQAAPKQQRSPATAGTQPKTLKHPSFDTGRRWPHPAAKPVLDGLLPPPPAKLRRVPNLVNANHIPFLRFKKPQSPFLSYIIRKKTVEREKRVDRMQALEKQLEKAEDEDEWDKILRDHHQISTDDNGTRWATATREALNDVKQVHQNNTVKRMEVAQRMFDIYQEESKLADKERLERRDRRHQAYKARRKERKEREASGAAGQIHTGEEDMPAASAGTV
ncbi:MAG: hypothetical protein LQ345_004822 [Seirophora villosa]|nr:MAG: hypothetical protein LQ345_004822 [Seirophora villosa]